MRIGLITDTHLPSLVRSLDELGPQIGDVLRGVDLILHAGDVTAPSVIEWCAQFAPILIAEGNNDLFDDARMAKRQLLDLNGWRIGMAHELRPESRAIDHILKSSLQGERVDILIGGDTHVERLEHREGTLLINSTPWSQVIVDGRVIGNTPQMNISLPSGSHRVELVNEQFNVRETLTVQITPGETTRRIVRLQIPTGG